MSVAAAAPKPDLARLNALLAPYREPSAVRSWLQVADSFAAYFGLLALTHWAAATGRWWLAAPAGFAAALALMRVFIIQHDCGHGAFFRSQRACDALGAVIGALTLTPYAYWKQTHAIHHATSGNLDARGWGDIDTRTVAEYRAMSPRARLLYRVYRSIPVLFFLGPAFHFLVFHRLPWAVPADWKAERRSILLNDLALALVVYAAWRLGAGWTQLAVQAAVCALSACVGVWFFYVQHQYEHAYWRREKEWDFAEASLRGSSYYRLPRLLQWSTGNIGFHHIHHLNSRVPNYRLEACYRENPEFQRCETLTLGSSLRCARLALWDESKGRLVSFAEAGV
jgi:omega-6 fatty acid desaturase (delta-12 desaturase)